jgi:predicted transcriptional regulator
MDAPDDAVAFLAASSNRVTLLGRLRTQGPARRRTCYELLDASRRTVKRTLSALEDRGWVRQTDDGYHVTALGDVVYVEYDRMQQTLSVAERLRPFLRNVPGDAFDLDLRHLADAEVVFAEDSSPYAPMDRALEFRRGSSRLRELSSVVARDSVAQLTERLDEEDQFDVEVVLSADAVESARANDDYASDFGDHRTADALSMYVYEGTLPFLLTIGDESVALGATDESGVPAALVVSDADRVRSWASDVYERYRAAARPP